MGGHRAAAAARTEAAKCAQVTCDGVACGALHPLGGVFDHAAGDFGDLAAGVAEDMLVVAGADFETETTVSKIDPIDQFLLLECYDGPEDRGAVGSA
jgi:hypothetical protein